MPSIDYGKFRDISKAEMQVWNATNMSIIMLQKIAFFNLFLHMGGCPLNIGDNFSLLSQSIFVFVRKHFMHSCSPKMCITPEKSQNCVWKATEKARRASRYDFKQSKPFIATLGNF